MGKEDSREDNELREFVYLDSMSVNSLLASQHMAVPEAVRSVSEDIDTDDTKKGINASIGYNSIAKISGNWTKGDTEQQRNLAETERRINDQYRFSILHRVLSESGKLDDVDETKADEQENFSLGQGDVVKATGVCVTDPFYRLLTTMSSLMRIGEIENIAGQNIESMDDLVDSEGETFFDVMKDVLHGEYIGLKINPRNYRYPVLMSVDVDDLWVTPEREFKGVREYTVVGRITQILNGTLSICWILWESHFLRVLLTNSEESC